MVEPWFSRRRIINRFVWVIEWVPVEFIKTISTRCCGDGPNTTVTTRTVLDRELLTPTGAATTDTAGVCVGRNRRG